MIWTLQGILLSKVPSFLTQCRYTLSLLWFESNSCTMKYSLIIIQHIILYSFFCSHILSPQHQRWKRRKGMSRLGRDWKRRKGMPSQPSHRAFLFFFGLFCIHYIGLLKALLSPTRTRKMISIFVITTIQTQSLLNDSIFFLLNSPDFYTLSRLYLLPIFWRENEKKKRKKTEKTNPKIEETERKTKIWGSRVKIESITRRWSSHSQSIKPHKLAMLKDHK